MASYSNSMFVPIIMHGVLVVVLMVVVVVVGMVVGIVMVMLMDRVVVAVNDLGIIS